MKKLFIIFVVIFFVAVTVLSYLVYEGYLWFNTPGKSEYPVRGIDVSNHQGNIDWAKPGAQDISFAFIKATEGSDFIDKSFAKNWKASGEAGIVRGAYHFFTFRSGGTDQARNFIATVPKESGMLPPVIDLEFDGNSKITMSKTVLQGELAVFIKMIKEQYGVCPVLYLTYGSFETFINDDFGECDIWIRDIVFRPRLSGNRDYLFWQFSNRGRIEGISGFVDLNVFRGTRQEFNHYVHKTSEAIRCNSGMTKENK